MKSFLKSLFASYIGTCFSIASIIVAFVLLCAFVVGALVGRFKAECDIPTSGQNNFLVVDLSRGFSANSTFSRYNNRGILSNGKGCYGLFDTLCAIQAAAADPEICGIFITGSGGDLGYATAQELQEAFLRFKAQCPQKAIIAYLPQPSQREYFLALAADKIWIHPFAKFPLNGMVSQGLYFKDALEKAGVGIQIVKVGQYKSAVEPLISDSMSPEDRTQRTMLLTQTWGTLLGDLAARRGVDGVAMGAAAETVGIYSPEDAEKLKLIDGARYDDEVVKELSEISGTDKDINSFNQISLSDYIVKKGISAPPKFNLIDFGDGPENQVAIVYAEGEIVDGDGSATELGGDSFAALLREIRNNKNVRAVVMHVNSPGGSVYASEKIRRELELISAQKPLVVSFGDVAASGGYWISTPAQKIFARPLTITGSIGVFGVLPNFENLGKFLGINSEAVTTSALAEIETMRRPKTPQEMQILQKDVDDIYKRFVSLVAKSRNRTPEEIAEIGEGRVWSGISAKSIGLVDDFGGIVAAAEFAANAAGIAPGDVNFCQYPRPVNPTLEFAKQFDDDGEPPFARAGIASQNSPAGKLEGVFKKTWSQLRALNDPNGIYARIPWSFSEPE